jgi:hypothetical protein
MSRHPPENDTQQHKREREFQDRVLAALSAPKQSRFLKFINAPLFIWLLTLAVVVIGGGLYTNYKTCLADSKHLAQSYNAYRNEVNFREKAIADAILASSPLARFVRRSQRTTSGAPNLETCRWLIS